MRYRLLIFILSLLFYGYGCISVISQDIRKDADRTITIQMVQANPDAFISKRVIWGGIIISSKNLKDKTVIEVLQTPLDERDMVLDRDVSAGRFIIEAGGFLDTFIYRTGREITAAGIIKGLEIQKIEELEYKYPVIESVQIRIFDPEPDIRYSYPPVWWYYPPYESLYPWWRYAPPYHYPPPWYLPPK